MDQRFDFSTDTATLAIFDPQIAGVLAAGDPEWWTHADLHELDAIRDGRLAIIGLGSDGAYGVRVTDKKLGKEEEAYATEVVELGLTIESGKIAVTSAEAMAGATVAADAKPGTYSVTCYRIGWHLSPNPEHIDRPAFVAVLKKRRGAPPALDEEPALRGDSDTFLFPAKRGRFPNFGDELVGTVYRKKDELTIQQIDRWDGEARLVDYEGTQWRDRVRFKVVSVDHKAKRLRGKLVSVIPLEEAILEECASRAPVRAAERLGEMGEAAAFAVPNLMKVVLDPNHFNRHACIDALIEIGAPARAAVEAASSSHPIVQGDLEKIRTRLSAC